jgi:hypothetical protein
MSTAAPAQAPAKPAASNEIIVYSHSTVFYWWPVWACGFIMFLVSFFSGEVLAIVPRDTSAEKGRELNWLQDDGARDILVLPKGKHLPPDPDNPDKLKQPKLHIASSKNVGVLFCTILLLVIFITNVPLRGLWSVIVIGLLFFLAIIFALLHIRDRSIWDIIFENLSFLDIRINAGGYFFISVILFIIWAIITFTFDKQIYMVFAPGQFRVRETIGEGEKAFGTEGLTFQKHRNDLFRHMILGFGSGDLTVNVQNQTFEGHNILSLGRRVKQIEDMLKQKVVIAGQR